MKSFNNLRNSLFLGCLALGTIGLLTPGLTLAQGKGASKLMFAPASQTQAATVSASARRSCARCTDAYTRVVDENAKGIRAGSMRMAAVHGCPACQTKIMSVGTGKAKTDKVVHSCGQSSPSQSSCCMAVK